MQRGTRSVQFLVITGLSGAGKTEAVHAFEDMGYFCVDNVPPALLPRLAELCRQTSGGTRQVAVVVDIRGGAFFDDTLAALRTFDDEGIPYQILFLEADEQSLVRRYQETRRTHPLARGDRVLEGIHRERTRLAPLRRRAHRIVDTSGMTRYQLRRRLEQLYGESSEGGQPLHVTLMSFGFKHGLPLDADLVFDARCLPNPHYVDELRDQPGTSAAVRSYLLRHPQTRPFIERLEAYLRFVLPLYQAEGRKGLTVAVGCTGGRHRSPFVVEEVAKALRSIHPNVVVEHRDLERGEFLWDPPLKNLGGSGTGSGEP